MVQHVMHLTSATTSTRAVISDGNGALSSRLLVCTSVPLVAGLQQHTST